MGEPVETERIAAVVLSARLDRTYRTDIFTVTWLTQGRTVLAVANSGKPRMALLFGIFRCS